MSLIVLVSHGRQSITVLETTHEPATLRLSKSVLKHGTLRAPQSASAPRDESVPPETKSTSAPRSSSDCPTSRPFCWSTKSFVYASSTRTFGFAAFAPIRQPWLVSVLYGTFAAPTLPITPFFDSFAAS